MKRLGVSVKGQSKKFFRDKQVSAGEMIFLS